MSLIAVERIKLFTTRSPWWCMVLAIALAVGFISLGYAFAPDDISRSFRPVDTQGTYIFGLIVMMVMATLSVTTEYRFGTIRTSFLAVPQRSSVLLAKTAVAAVLSGLVGLVAAFCAWGLGVVMVADADLALNGANDWRALLGVGAIYFLAAIMAVSVGTLIRQSAGAIAIMISWPLLLEGIGLAIPKVGEFIADWGPFSRASWFVNGNQGASAGETSVATDQLMSPTASLLYFAAWAAALLVISLVVANKRDA